MTPLPEPLRVGIVGVGYFGRFHLDAWSRIEGCEIVGLADPDTSAARAAMRDRSADAPIFVDAGEMLAARTPDIVDIVTPPAAHLDLIRAVAPSVAGIICQKPFCGGLKCAREAVALCEAAGTRLAVHENIRFQPWYRESKALLDSGRLGTVWQASFRLRPGDGQGPDAYLARQPYFQTMARFLIHETAVHWVDTFRYLFGEASGVFARLARLNPAIAGEDAGIILLEFEAGQRALFDGNRLTDHIAGDRRRTLGEMVVEGSDATLRLDGDGRLWLRDFGSNDEVEHRFAWRDHLFGGDCVHACTAGIVAAWRACRPAETEAAAYLRNLDIVEAIYESAREGRFLDIGSGSGYAAR